jgi:hypothetical protein
VGTIDLPSCPEIKKRPNPRNGRGRRRGGAAAAAARREVPDPRIKKKELLRVNANGADFDK